MSPSPSLSASSGSVPRPASAASVSPSPSRSISVASAPATSVRRNASPFPGLVTSGPCAFIRLRSAAGVRLGCACKQHRRLARRIRARGRRAAERVRAAAVLRRVGAPVGREQIEVRAAVGVADELVGGRRVVGAQDRRALRVAAPRRRADVRVVHAADRDRAADARGERDARVVALVARRDEHRDARGDQRRDRARGVAAAAREHGRARVLRRRRRGSC